MGDNEVPRRRQIQSTIAAYKRFHDRIGEPKYYSKEALNSIRRAFAEQSIRDAFGTPFSAKELTITELLVELARRLEMKE